MTIVDSNLSLDFESDQNRRLNSDSRFDLTMAIRFVTPNHISLVEIKKKSDLQISVLQSGTALSPWAMVQDPDASLDQLVHLLNIPKGSLLFSVAFNCKFCIFKKDW